jgi:hypothetical protein
MRRPERLVVGAALGLAGLAALAGLGWAAAEGRDPMKAALAPDIVDLDEAAASADERLARAEALITALARVHNQLGEGLAAGQDPCGTPALADLWARSRALGPGVRDAAQAARAATDRVERLRVAQTVAPLLDPERQRGLDGLGARTAAAARAAVELGAWQAKALPPPTRCALPALAPAHGLRAPSSVTENDRIAVLVSAPGLLCGPGLQLAVGAGPATPPTAALCWAADACGCTPITQRPGAVLGPGPLPPAEPVVPTPVLAAVTGAPAAPSDEGVDLEAGPQLPLLDPEAPVAVGPPDTDLRGRDEALGPALPVGQTPP